MVRGWCICLFVCQDVIARSVLSESKQRLFQLAESSSDPGLDVGVVLSGNIPGLWSVVVCDLP